MKIGRTIKQLRKEKKLSQIELTDECGITQTSLSQIEADLTRPTQKNLNSICNALGITESLLYILSIEEDDVPESKKEAFQTLFPSVKDMMVNLFSRSLKSI